MSISPARKSAFEILLRVEAGRHFAVDLLQGESLVKLKEVDRNLATELVMGSLRRRGELDGRIEELSGKQLAKIDREVAVALRLGIYQILYLDRIPRSASVNDSVELVKLARKRSAAGFVNAILRKCVRGDSAARSERPIAGALQSLPAWLRERWERNFGPEAARSLAISAVERPPTVLRATSAGEREALQASLRNEGIETRPGRFGRCALVVEAGDVVRAACVRERRAVIQDEASQLVAELLAPRPGECTLDLCAAPGIKTGQLALAQASGLLVACDLSARRLQKMAKLLPSNLPAGLRLAPVRLDATLALPFGCKFLRILVDAPCSGTGTLARNPELKWRLTSNDITRLADIQTRILARAFECLAPGGRLVYSTCSLEPEENEMVVEKVLAARPDIRPFTKAELSSEFPHLAPLFDEQGFFRTRPDLHAMDGFFAAIIRLLVR